MTFLLCYCPQILKSCLVYDSYNIDVHDYSVRLKAAQKFLKDGDKVAYVHTSI